jgi:hypothetical protein
MISIKPGKKMIKIHNQRNSTKQEHYFNKGSLHPKLCPKYAEPPIPANSVYKQNRRIKNEKYKNKK